MERYHQDIQEAIKNLKVADHIIYITYPIIKDKRLLLKSLDSVYQSIICIINSVLHYEYIWKKIILSKDSKENFETFLHKSSRRLELTDADISDIIELFSIVESHKKSTMEFLRKEKVVIMSDTLRTNIIDSEKIKKYLNLTKRLIEKVKFYTNMP